MTEWTPGLLKEHVDRVLAEQDRRYADLREADAKAVSAALAAAALAVDKAEANSEKWRQNANEWRGAMSDRERDFMTTSEGEDLRRQINDLKESRDKGSGRLGGLTAGWGYLVGVVGLAGTVIAIVIAVN